MGRYAGVYADLHSLTTTIRDHRSNWRADGEEIAGMRNRATGKLVQRDGNPTMAAGGWLNQPCEFLKTMQHSGAIIVIVTMFKRKTMIRVIKRSNGSHKTI